MSDLFTTREGLIGLAYLVAAFLFVLGLRYLSNPTTARRGNQIAAGGMAIAVLATFFLHDDNGEGMKTTNIILIIIAIAIGAVASTYPSRKVPMTAMPQMVAIFNGMGGATAAIVDIAEYNSLVDAGATISTGEALAVAVGSFIGSVAFAGSIVAFLKLQELISGRPIRFGGQSIVNALLAVAVVALTVLLVGFDGGTLALWALVTVSLALGVLVVLPIGGADMPVVISVLNSMTGVAAAVAGFVLDNQILIVAGALVGASGALLTVLMSRAMNRSLTNVLFGAFGTLPAGGPAAGAVEERPIRQTTAEDAAVAMAYANEVIIVPGYGLAVAQAQHQIRELAEELEKRGVTVKYAIHPVAGRMPGHMNVLLAEANVPYDQLYEMERWWLAPTTS